jgi:hypothetical protein
MAVVAAGSRTGVSQPLSAAQRLVYLAKLMPLSPRKERSMSLRIAGDRAFTAYTVSKRRRIRWNNTALARGRKTSTRPDEIPTASQRILKPASIDAAFYPRQQAGLHRDSPPFPFSSVGDSLSSGTPDGSPQKSLTFLPFRLGCVGRDDLQVPHPPKATINVSGRSFQTPKFRIVLLHRPPAGSTTL